MKAQIIINMNTPAFHDEPASELGRILRDIMYGVELWGEVRTILKDRNGVEVGTFWIE